MGNRARERGGVRREKRWIERKETNWKRSTRRKEKQRRKREPEEGENERSEREIGKEIEKKREDRNGEKRG